MPSRPDLGTREGKLLSRFATYPVDKVLKDAEGLASMLCSSAWMEHVEMRIGPIALRDKTHAAMLSMRGDGLDMEMQRIKAMHEFWHQVGRDLQQMISFLMEQNAPMSDALRAMYVVPPGVTQRVPEVAMSPFGMDPPMTSFQPVSKPE